MPDDQRGWEYTPYGWAICPWCWCMVPSLRAMKHEKVCAAKASEEVTV